MLGSFSSTSTETNGVLAGKWSAYVIFTILGIGNLLPWNAFVTAAKYYGDQFCDTPFESSFESYFSMIYTLAQPFGLLLNIYYHSQITIQSLIFYPLIIYALVFYIITALVATPSIEPYALFSITMLANFVCGVVGSIMNGGMFAMTGMLPSSYTAAIMNGQAAAGLIVALVSTITVAVNPSSCGDDDDADDGSCSHTNTLDYGALAYFIVACITLTVCVWLYLVLIRLPFIAANMDRLADTMRRTLSLNKRTLSIIQVAGHNPVHTDHATEPTEHSSGVVKEPPMDKQNSKPAENLERSQHDSKHVKISFSIMSVTHVVAAAAMAGMTTASEQTDEGTADEVFDLAHVTSVARTIIVPSYSVFIIFLGTLMVFPAIMVLIEPTHPCSQSRLYGDLWIPVMFVLLNAGDVIGRILAQIGSENKYITPTNIHIHSTVRLAIPVLLLFCNIPDNHLDSAINTDGVVLLLIFLLGFSNGLLANLAMMFGPGLVSLPDAPLAGTIMMFWLNCGLLLGSALSFLWLYVVTGSVNG
ncbi:hypothetical protein EON65_21650 [archaeon]|nr:MAG: hypothetical protein EON65_21650 [archaeon]